MRENNRRGDSVNRPIFGTTVIKYNLTPGDPPGRPYVKIMNKSINKNIWRTVPFSEIADINPRMGKTTLADDELFSFVPMASVGASDGSIDVSAKRPYIEVKKGFTPFQSGDVLFAKITPCMENGKMAVVPHLENQHGFGSTEFHVIRPKDGNDPKYVYYYVSGQGFRKEAAHHMTGAVGQKRVPTDFIKQSLIPLPPTIEDQKRIVAEIEKQFSRLDEAVASLKRIQANLKRYKAAVLKAAVEGKLTEEWRRRGEAVPRPLSPEVPSPNAIQQRATHRIAPTETGADLLKRILAERRAKWEAEELAKMKAKGIKPKDDSWKKKYKEPAGPDTANLPELPEGWVWATLPQLGELNRGKSKHRPRNAPHLYGGSYPFVQTGDIRAANRILKSYSQTYSEAGLEQSRLWPTGTLCITIAANIADTAILGIDACFPDSVVGFLVEQNHCETGFVEYFIRTAKENIERYAPATAQKNINLEILAEIAVALPPLKEQRTILEEIDRRLSVTEELEATIETNLKRAERLRQTILQQAFSGGLL